MINEAYPEYVIETPHPTNGFRWVWSICQPDGCWGELAGGAEYDKSTAINNIRNWFFCHEYELSK